MPQTGQIVFVVDDEPIIAKTFALILNKAGYQAFSFFSTIDALRAASSNAPDVLISDVIMPKMTGVELAIHFRQRHPACRVLLFSGQSATSDLLKKARKDGYDFEILAKPVPPEELLAALRGE